jgi:general stress protein YciG
MGSIKQMKDGTSRKKQGLASLSPERRREIASKGGKRAVELGVGHRWTPEEAAEAGRKGGLKSRRGARKDVPSGTRSPKGDGLAVRC